MNLLRSAPLLGILLFICIVKSFAQDALLDLYYAGKYDEVIGITGEAIKNGDTTFDLYYLKALSEAQLGRSDQAIRTLEQACLIFPEEARISRMLAEQYHTAGAYPEAAALFRELVHSDSADLSSLLKLAEIAIFRQQYDEALPVLHSILAIDSTNLNGLMMMADVLSRLDSNETLDYFEKAYAIYPENQKVAYALANGYVQEDSAAKAIPVCERILEKDSTSIRFQKLLGYAYYKTGKPTAAIEHFQQATILGDSTAFTFKFKGISHFINVEFVDAISALQLALEIDSMDAETHFFLGATLGTTTRKKEAMVHLERSLQLMKPDPAVMARIHSEQGNIMRLEMEYERAYSLYELAWQADTTDPVSLYFMASILDNSLHRSRDALVDYRRFLDQLDRIPDTTWKDQQIPTLRGIVEDRIELLTEELFFLDEQ